MIKMIRSFQHYWAKILVVPRKGFAHGRLHGKNMAALEQQVLLVLTGGAEQAKKRLLLLLKRIGEIIFPIEHQDRCVNSRSEVEDISFRR